MSRLVSSYTTRRYMIFAVIYAIKTTAKKKPEKVPEFKFFRFLFHNYLNCIYNSEDCIITSLLTTAGQFLHNNYYRGGETPVERGFA